MATILFLYPTLANKGVKLPGDFTIKQVIHLCMMLLAYYLNAYLLVPQLLLKGKYFYFVLTIIVFVFFASYTMAIVENRLDLREQMKHVWTKKPGKAVFDRFGFLTTLITLGISTSISVINKLNKDNKKQFNLEKEQITTELSMLKAQIHPHFFFNTLNSIYALSYTDAESSRKTLTKLSHIMRYLLYETNQSTTELSKELSFITHYIEIMKLRLNTNTTVEINLPETVSPVSIAPMILMPYIENVFKHGIDESDNNKLFISIHQHTKGIRLVTRNKIAAKPVLTAEYASGGIGMQNTLRRLELLYKNKYKLSAGKKADSNEFELTLELQLQ